MPKITRTRYGGVWPSSSAESDGTIYALDGVDADVSDASLRPMRAPRLVSTETGGSLFVEDCVLLVNTKRVFTARDRKCAHAPPDVAKAADWARSRCSICLRVMQSGASMS